MKKVLLVAVSVLLVCTSCVTKKKYLLAENGRLEAMPGKTTCRISL